MERTVSATFTELTPLTADRPTLIEGLPGHGLVASIAAEQITTQLDLSHHGNIISETFPQVTSFKDGRVRDIVRLYAGDDPAIMTLQSDIVLPGVAYKALGQCLLDDLANEFRRAIFLAGAPASREGEIGTVEAVATTAELHEEVRGAGIESATGIGLIGGITGALVNACFHADVPAAVLIVKANPFLPDPAAAQAVIEDALEPLVDFDIDTSELQEQADSIRSRMEQVAQQYQQLTEAGFHAEEIEGPTMYQ